MNYSDGNPIEPGDVVALDVADRGRVIASMDIGRSLSDEVRRFAVMAMLVAPLSISARTLCANGETDYFSCQTRGHRIASVCGQIRDSPGAEEWLQYRFGHPRRLEMTWPEARSDSLRKFDGNVFDAYAVSDLRFRVGDAFYGLSLSRGSEEDGGGGRTRRTAGVIIERPGHPDIHLECVHPNMARYGEGFETLNALLSTVSGRADTR